MPKVFKSINDSKLIKLIQDGAVGVLPADTVYVIACRAVDQQAVEKLYALKSRDKKPGTIIAANIDQVVELGVKRSYLKAVEQFWPGQVGVVIPFSDPSGSYLRQGKPDIAVRIPSDKAIVSLLEKTGALFVVKASKANQPLATNVKAAEGLFGDKIDFYVDGGDLKDRQPSTVIRIVDDAVEVLRQGAVKIENNGVAK